MRITKYITTILIVVITVTCVALSADAKNRRKAHRRRANYRQEQVEKQKQVMEEAAIAELSEDMSNASLADRIIADASRYLGVRYRHGAGGPRGFDCSGFTSYIFKHIDIDLSRSSRDQYKQGEQVESISELRPGDLVFFSGSRRSRSQVGHVGIVVSVDDNGKDFRFIHAARTGIRFDNLSEAYYSQRYIGARRVLD